MLSESYVFLNYISCQLVFQEALLIPTMLTSGECEEVRKELRVPTSLKVTRLDASY